ncbi:MAG: saccharopine dehydrogenase [Gammaproteobacteria bacterium]|jgi:short subunit dehydrogenase-like uncharacterized protein|nr:saccharopine dehydrogenase [Gammaproteobacteria bacterium]
MTDRHDIVVYGATSFVGRILTRYLFEQYGVGRDVNWAIAARSGERLAALRAELGPDAARLPIIVAEASDVSALDALCARARVVVSTVGPYALHGEPLVAACVRAGIDYCDLTGEVQWIRRMIVRYEAAAVASGARIVHCCGFDSIPSDLGVHFLQGEMRRRHGRYAQRIVMRVKAMRGSMSGGTVASLLNVVKESVADPALRRELVDPYSLCVAREVTRVRQASSKVAFDREFGAWTMPFVMAGINTRIVQRSHALAGAPYGEFRYDEAVLAGRGFKGRLAATFGAFALGGFMFAAALAPLRKLLERYVLPKPGEGPSPEAQLRGFFDLRFAAHAADGQTLRAKVTGDRDPGYGSTAKMLGQAAACLAFDLRHGERRGGFWTPATLLGDRLVERLVAYAGLRFEIDEGRR